MSYVPPFFSKFGKTCSDLLSQKWDGKKDDFKHSLTIKSQNNNVTVTSTATVDDPAFSSLSGKSKVEYKDKAWGDASVEVSTAGKIKATTKLNKLQKGLVVNAEGESTLTAYPKGRLATEYSRENFAATCEYAQAKNSVTASASVGVEGLSAGAVAVADINKLSSGASPAAAISVDAGAQYEDGNLIGTAVFEKQSDVVLSLYHRVSSDLQLGTRFVLTPNVSHSFAVAGQYKFSPETLGKAKVEIVDAKAGSKNYTLSTFVEHKLSNPNVIVALSNQFGPGVSKYGVSFSFGDK